MAPRRKCDPSVTHRRRTATAAWLCCAHLEIKVAVYQGFVGLAGVEPATSALSVQTPSMRTGPLTSHDGSGKATVGGPNDPNVTPWSPARSALGGSL